MKIHSCEGRTTLYLKYAFVCAILEFESKNKLYDDLFNNQPCGIKYTSLINQEFPIYRGFSDQSIQTSMFDVPDS